MSLGRSIISSMGMGGGLSKGDLNSVPLKGASNQTLKDDGSESSRFKNQLGGFKIG